MARKPPKDKDRFPVKAHTRGKKPLPPPPGPSMLAQAPGGDNANFPGAPGGDNDADDFPGGM
jgi:hypothetical protein